MTRKPQLDGGSLLIGALAGAGLAAAASLWLNRNPNNRLDQRLVNRALDSAYDALQKFGPLPLEGDYRYVIFSDHHKGARNGADDFRQCEQTYLAALDHYDSRRFTLVTLGDCEELLEEKIPDVMHSYANVFRQEARFHPDRLIRVNGNHDLSWQTPEIVQQYMQPIFPELAYHSGLLLEYRENGQPCGQIMLVHGHQGTVESDLFPFFARWVLPYYRDFQIRTGLGRTSPSTDDCLRSEVDNRMYRWVSRKRKLILIAGHTHRPVWSSKTHLEKLIDELYALMRLDPAQRPPNYEQLVAEKKREVEERQAKYPPCNDVIKTKPAYFNDGCCRYDDGDITGIEIENGLIRLVKWSTQSGMAVRACLEENTLAEIFLYL